MTRQIIAVAAVIGAQWVSPAFAQSSGNVMPLFDLLRLPEMLDVMHEEGLVFGQSIDDQLLGGQGGTEWKATLESVYDVERMRALVEAGIEQSLVDVDREPIHAFFTTAPGPEILSLELSARWVILDPDIEAFAMQAAAAALAAKSDRMARIVEFAAQSDLIERNVMGAMNSNIAFMHGLVAAGTLPPGTTEDGMLADVWSQEPQIRASTTEWLYSYLYLAYQPLSDAELELYVAFLATSEGRALNAAMFIAFDALFEDVSYTLGMEATTQLAREDL